MADIIIVGAGPAGLSAAIYARRAGMDTVLYEGEMYGGQISGNTADGNNSSGGGVNVKGRFKMYGGNIIKTLP